MNRPTFVSTVGTSDCFKAWYHSRLAGVKARSILVSILACALLGGGWLFVASIHKSPDAAAQVPATSHPETSVSTESRILADLIDPVKLTTLKVGRAANPRLRKITYWLESGRRSGQNPDTILFDAQQLAAYQGTPRGEADRDSLLRNRTILERLGCLDESGMDRLRRGLAPTITQGPYAGDIATVDHVLPFSVVPELDACLYNLEFMPSTLNQNKGAKVGQRQIDLARKWRESNLLSEEGFRAVSMQFQTQSGTP